MPSHPVSRTASFEDILDHLERLTREHLLFYRVQVGTLLLQQFWGDDAAAFSSRDNTKEARFDLFFSKCTEELTRYGLSKRKARDSIRACIVIRSLPVALREQLFLSQVLELTRLHDPTQRAQVAQVAVAEDWSVTRLRNAVTAVRAGLPLDADPDTPGVQLADSPEQPLQLAPGRIVTRGEKLASQLDAWAASMETVNVATLKPAQRQRMTAALTQLEARVTTLRATLLTSEV